VINRVCVPSPTVFKNAFQDYATSISDHLRQAGVANFITDLQNVIVYLDRTGNGCWLRWGWQLSYLS